MKQGTPEWHEARRGHVSASRLADVFAGHGTKRRKRYVAQLLSERTGMWPEAQDDPVWFAHGREWESSARMAYALETGRWVDEIGIVYGPGGFVASPDGLVDGDGGIEIKCYKSDAEFAKASRRVPALYRPQVMGNLYATGRGWWDFVAYHIHSHDMVIHRSRPDPSYFDRIRIEVFLVNREVDRAIRRSRWLQSRYSAT